MLGAGFSKWAADLPLASELFDFEIQPFGPREARRLQRVLDLWTSWQDQHNDETAEQFIAHALTLEARQRADVLWYVGRRLSGPFIWEDYYVVRRRRRRVLMIDEDRRKEIPGVVRAMKFLRSICTPFVSGIVTTNYDMLVEYALGTRGFNYGARGEQLHGPGPYPLSAWGIPVTLSGWVKLAKIHGSISWDQDDRYSDGRRALTGRALIVAPTSEKQAPSELRSVWELASSILRSTSALLVFGFAFNPYDEAVLSLLREGGRRIGSVLVVDIAPPLGRVADVWPEATVRACRPPPDGRQVIREWLKAAGSD